MGCRKENRRYGDGLPCFLPLSSPSNVFTLPALSYHHFTTIPVSISLPTFAVSRGVKDFIDSEKESERNVVEKWWWRRAGRGQKL